MRTIVKLQSALQGTKHARTQASGAARERLFILDSRHEEVFQYVRRRERCPRGGFSLVLRGFRLGCHLCREYV